MSNTRREFIRRTVAAAVLVATGTVAVWELIQLRPSSGGQTGVTTLSQPGTGQQSGTATQGVPAGYLFVTAMSALSGKSSAYFSHPTYGQSLLLGLAGQWKAFSATCTHAPCTVGYSGSQIQCPCHGGVFDPSNGAVISGPPPTRLPEYGVLVQNGNLYVTNSIVN